MQLIDCAHIKTGLVLGRKSLKSADETSEIGENWLVYPHLTLKTFSAEGVMDFSHLGEIMVEKELKPQYLTQKGDIIMRLSAPYTAILITKEQEGLVISSNFVKICPNIEELSPEFLCWVLNSEETKLRLQSATSCTMLGSMSQKILGKLEIMLPTGDIQEKIGTLHHLFLREQQLLRLLQEKKEVFQTTALQQIYKNSKGN